MYNLRTSDNLKNIFRIFCDSDGWSLNTNEETFFDHMFHVFPPELVKSVKISGDFQMHYIGFDTEGKLT